MVVMRYEGCVFSLVPRLCEGRGLGMRLGGSTHRYICTVRVRFMMRVVHTGIGTYSEG